MESNLYRDLIYFDEIKDEIELLIKNILKCKIITDFYIGKKRNSYNTIEFDILKKEIFNSINIFDLETFFKILYFTHNHEQHINTIEYHHDHISYNSRLDIRIAKISNDYDIFVNSYENNKSKFSQKFIIIFILNTIYESRLNDSFKLKVDNYLKNDNTVDLKSKLFIYNLLKLGNKTDPYFTNAKLLSYHIKNIEKSKTLIPPIQMQKNA